jgi:hypothetical protein
MATQWYYLDGFTENGPFDGKQMLPNSSWSLLTPKKTRAAWH